MPRNDVCYICGAVGADSREHVIPRAFFGGALPDNVLTLPAHKPCHNQMKEEYVRVVLTGLAENSPAADILWGDKVARSVGRNNPLRTALARGIQPALYVVENNQLHAIPGFKVDTDQFYPTMEKIVQGLYYHHTGKLLPLGIRMKWALNEELAGAVGDMFEQSKEGVSYPDVFESRYLIHSEEGVEASVWWLRFYNATVLRCYVPPPVAEN